MRFTPLRDAAALGYGSEEIIQTVQSIEASHFYKSMQSVLRNAARSVVVRC
ncbi:type II toxin-antitoxin system MqsR family toxin [Tardiphaga sp.]|uniref:type II toxin-antitoxin system MqsR family toxin n=1 Tax=Tardiphaga sp. TaxID=1926292 RepID=UPI0025EDBDAF|nr:type II toxin-antitoxin system MqsR family toxin [Tardiphaga sp.]